MNKKQKKIFFCVCMIFFLFLIVTIYLFKQKSPYEYLKEQKGMTAQTTANECLEEIRFDNKYIVFFINENGNLSCAVMKKKMNIIDNLQYSFRICWIIGNGEENTPPEHEEIKIGSSI